MSIYVVQARGAETTALERARFIKDGFSWPAFLFGGLWLLYRRLWLPLAVYLVLEIAFLSVVAPHLGVAAMTGVDLLVHLFIGFEGNRWRQTKGARTMAITDLVEARDRDEAEAIFFARHAPAPTGTLA